MIQEIFVGNYSEKGINRMEFDYNNNTLEEKSKIGNLKNNSYICKYKDYLYSVVEIDGDENVDCGYVAVYKLNGSEAKFINSTISYGKSPCFVTVDPTRDILYVANYSGGSFVAFKLKEDGSIGEKLCYKKFNDISKIHHIQFSDDYKSVYIIDLGEDCLIQYDIDYKQKQLNLTERCRFYFPKESYARHMAIDGKNNIYVVTEKSCEVYKLKHNDVGKLIMLEKESILPEGVAKKENYTGCAIKIDSKKQYMYISVRGHNSISVFDINNKCRLIQNVECVGSIPRDVEIDKYEKYLLCANQGSNNISIFRIQNGILSYQTKYTIEKPTCIVCI